MVRMAGLAPSVNNMQPWKYYAFTNKETLNNLAEAVVETLNTLKLKKAIDAEKILQKVEFYTTFFKDAPVLMAVTLGEYKSMLEQAVELSHEEINDFRNYPNIQCLGASVQNFLLSAVSLGYGACWLSSLAIAKSKINQVLNIDENEKIFTFIAVGKPTTVPRTPERKSFDQIFEWRQ